jgi:hypothetical protein
MTTARDQALRAALVADVERSVRRRRWRLPAMGVGAFALAGALTAGALVSSGLLQQTASPQDAAAIVDTGAAGDVTFLGSPVTRVADGPTSLQLPSRPAGARSITVGAQCGSGHVTITVQGSRSEVFDCSSTSIGLPVPTASAPTVTFEPTHDAGITVWAAWTKPDPLPGPSLQQQLAMSDGIVTRSEYLAAWNRYLGCMQALGHPVGSPVQTSVIIATGIPGDALQADDRCEAAELSDVDGTWQTEHPKASEDPGLGSATWTAAADPKYAG